jgi:preprotein translocase subunit YajC
MGFSGTGILSELFFFFCFPIILLIFSFMVYRNFRQRKRRLENMLQGVRDKVSMDEESE